MHDQSNINLGQDLPQKAAANSPSEISAIERIKQFYFSTIEDVFLELNLQYFDKETVNKEQELIAYSTNLAAHLNATEIILDRLIFSVNQLTQQATIHEYHYVSSSADNLEALLIEVKKNLLNLSNLVSLKDLHQLLREHLTVLRDLIDGYATGADPDSLLRLDQQLDQHRQRITKTFTVIGNKMKTDHHLNDDSIFMVNSLSSEPDVILDNDAALEEASLMSLSPFECKNQEELLALFDSHSFLESTIEEDDFIFALGQIDHDLNEITDHVDNPNTLNDWFSSEDQLVPQAEDSELAREEDKLELVNEKLSDDLSNQMETDALFYSYELDQNHDDDTNDDQLIPLTPDALENLTSEQLKEITASDAEDTSFELFLMNLNQFEDQSAFNDRKVNSQSNHYNDNNRDLVNGIEFDDATFQDDLTIIEPINFENETSINGNNSFAMDHFLDDEMDTSIDIVASDTSSMSHPELLGDDIFNEQDSTSENLEELWENATDTTQDWIDWDADEPTTFQALSEAEVNQEDPSQSSFDHDSFEQMVIETLVPQNLSEANCSEDSLNQDGLNKEDLHQDNLTVNYLDRLSAADEYTYESFIDALDAANVSLDDESNLDASVNSLNSYDFNDWDWDNNETTEKHDPTTDYLTAIEELTEFDQFEGVHSISHIYDFSANEQLLETINVADADIFGDNLPIDRQNSLPDYMMEQTQNNQNNYQDNNDDLLSNTNFTDHNNMIDDISLDDDSYISALEQLINVQPLNLPSKQEPDPVYGDLLIADSEPNSPIDSATPSYQIDNLADFFDGTASVNMLDDSDELLDLPAVAPELVDHDFLATTDQLRIDDNEHQMFWENLRDIMTNDHNYGAGQSLSSEEFTSNNNGSQAEDLASEISLELNDDTEPSSGLITDLNLGQQLFTSQKIAQFHQHKKPVRIAQEELQHIKQLSENTLSRQTLLQQSIKGLHTVTNDLMVELSSDQRNHRLQELLHHLHRNLNQIEDNSQVMETSLSQIYQRINQNQICPFRQVSKRLRQLVQQWSMVYDQNMHKNVELCITGEDTWIDRQLTDILYDILQHLLRNAYEHGIESTSLRRHLGKHPTGIITIQAESNLQTTVISIHDDGAGFDLEKMRSSLHRQEEQQTIANDSLQDLLRHRTQHETNYKIAPPIANSSNDSNGNGLHKLTPSETLDNVIDLGFSGIKGMGIGLDIVRQAIQELGGTMQLETKVNQGTQVTLHLPSVPQLVTTIVLEQERMLIALPNHLVHQVVPFNSECLRHSNQVLANNQEGYLWEKELLPLIRLNQYLHINCQHRQTYLQYRPVGASPTVVIANSGEQRCAIVAEACWGLHQGIIHQVNGDIHLPSPFIGCLTIHNRQVVPVLNPDFLQEALG